MPDQPTLLEQAIAMAPDVNERLSNPRWAGQPMVKLYVSAMRMQLNNIQEAFEARDNDKIQYESIILTASAIGYISSLDILLNKR